MVLLDTNIFIYIASGKLNRQIVRSVDIAYASISKIEALGFPSIQANEQLLLKYMFDESYNLALSDAVIERSIILRQLKKMSLSDTIVAATALEYGVPLWSANTKGFSFIDGLEVVDPTLL